MNVYFLPVDECGGDDEDDDHRAQNDRHDDVNGKGCVKSNQIDFFIDVIIFIFIFNK